MKNLPNFSSQPFSVVISVYFGERADFLDQAFISIWDNQSLRPAQIVLVKDGSLTPELDIIINEWKDKLGAVLTLVVLPENVGLGAALNEGLKVCDHELVARMDTDDISLPKRFEKQISFMLEYPEIVAASGQVDEWDQSMKNIVGKRRLPQDSASVRVFAKRRSPLSHPLSIYRKSVVLEVGGYPPLRKAQDYALWSILLTKGYELANLPDTLLKMRTGDDLYARRGWGFLKHELALLNYQRQIGFIGISDFFINCMIKASLRLSPAFVKRLAYRYLR